MYTCIKTCPQTVLALWVSKFSSGPEPRESPASIATGTPAGTPGAKTAKTSGLKKKKVFCKKGCKTQVKPTLFAEQLANDRKTIDGCKKASNTLGKPTYQKACQSLGKHVFVAKKHAKLMENQCCLQKNLQNARKINDCCKKTRQTTRKASEFANKFAKPEENRLFVFGLMEHSLPQGP